MTSRSPAADDDAAYHQRLGLSITLAERDQVMGEMAVAPEACAADGTVRSATLFALADALVQGGAAMRLMEGRTLQTLDSRTSHFRACHPPLVRGHARPLHVGSGIMVWQTVLSDAGGAEVAMVTHTLLMAATEDALRVAPAQPPGGRPAVALQAADLGLRTAARAGKSGAAKVDARREHIAEAACSVISRKGYSNATIREIADAAGLHVPTLYQYVSSKDDVLELVYNWLVEQVRTDLAHATEGCKGARQKLQAAVAALIRRGSANRWQIGMLNRELKSLSPKGRTRVLAEFQTLMAQIGSIVEEGVASGEFRDVEPIIAANFVDAVVDVWALRQYSIGSFAVADFEQQAIQFLEAALLRGKPRK